MEKLPALIMSSFTCEELNKNVLKVVCKKKKKVVCSFPVNLSLPVSFSYPARGPKRATFSSYPLPQPKRPCSFLPHSQLLCSTFCRWEDSVEGVWGLLEVRPQGQRQNPEESCGVTLLPNPAVRACITMEGKRKWERIRSSS